MNKSISTEKLDDSISLQNENLESSSLLFQYSEARTVQEFNPLNTEETEPILNEEMKEHSLNTQEIEIIF